VQRRRGPGAHRRMGGKMERAMGIEPTTFSLGSGPIFLQINAMQEKAPHRVRINFKDLATKQKKAEMGDPGQNRAR
jgi:hypothetical protein